MLDTIAEKIFNLKYARKRPNGKNETWEQACGRVAEFVSRAEVSESSRLQSMADFTKIMLEQSFVPGGRILANAGTGIKNLMNCFVLPIEDSRQSIYRTLRDAAEIFAWGGGIGFNFSKLREQGSPVITTGGEASGPLSFMELFDTTGEIISQASRRGAQMGILNDNHPDILKFIEFKNTLNSRNARIFEEHYRLTGEHSETLSRVLRDNQLIHFNISVAITHEFMNRLRGGEEWQLVSPTGGVVDTLDANVIMDAITRSAWGSGDPGVYFIDRANEFSLAPYLGSLDATNPCGEVPLFQYETCNLGSINLDKFVEENYIDMEYLKSVVRTAVRFLDNVIDLSETPVEAVNNAQLATRRIGLGVMGFANVLAEMNIPYDDPDAFILARVLGQTIQLEAWKTSMALAKARGSFPAFDFEKTNWTLIDNLHLPRQPIRNVAVTSIAPTGTIALICGVNGGIEPFYSKKYIRNITEGLTNFSNDAVTQTVDFENIKTSHDISWSDHVKMQSIWQKYTDNAVSKTINMPASATVDEIKSAINLAWELGCKGVTIYRDKSRGFQILNSES